MIKKSPVQVADLIEKYTFGELPTDYLNNFVEKFKIKPKKK